MNKIKVFNKLFPWLNILSPLVDILIGIYVYNSYSGERQIFNYLGLLYVAYIVYRFGRALLKVSGSKDRARSYMADNRVIAMDGPQRRGKTSLAGYFGLCSGGDVFGNVPMKIRGKYTYQLTTEMLTCQYQLPQYSFLHIDECNLFYHNLKDQKKFDSLIFGQAALEQCIGHFTDGNMVYSSTDVFRLPKQIRDNFSSHLQVLGQESYQFSYIGSALIKIISKFFGVRRCFTGLRCWTAQHFEKISDDGYTYDLSSNTVDDKDKRYADMLQFAMFQSPNTFEYDDRYMRAFYDKLRIPHYERWKKLALDMEDFSLLYDSEILKYFKSIYSSQVANTPSEIKESV